MSRALFLILIVLASCSILQPPKDLDGKLLDGGDMSVSIGPVLFDPTNATISFLSITITNRSGMEYRLAPYIGFFASFDDFIGNYDDNTENYQSFYINIPAYSSTVISRAAPLSCVIPLGGIRPYVALDLLHEWNEPTYVNNVVSTTNRFYPALVAPLGLKISANSNGFVSLSWISNALADGYEIHRSIDNTSSYSNVGTNFTTFLTDALPQLDHVYYYKIKSYTNGVVTAGTADFLVINNYGAVLDSPGLAFYAWGNDYLVWGTDSDWPGVGTLGSCRSPKIKNHMTNSLQTVVNGTNISFYWKTSGYYQEYLVFYIDGSEMTRISWNTSWRKTNFSLTAGDHVVRWSYILDNDYETTVYNSAWLDYVKVLP